MHKHAGFDCVGSIKERTGCGVCPKCLYESKIIINTNKRAPLHKIDPKTVKALSRACEILRREYGPNGFQKFIRTGK